MNNGSKGPLVYGLCALFGHTTEYIFKSSSDTSVANSLTLSTGLLVRSTMNVIPKTSLSMRRLGMELLLKKKIIEIRHFRRNYPVFFIKCMLMLWNLLTLSKIGLDNMWVT